jgi:hypothetical protein
VNRAVARSWCKIAVAAEVEEAVAAPLSAVAAEVGAAGRPSAAAVATN